MKLYILLLIACSAPVIEAIKCYQCPLHTNPTEVDCSNVKDGDKFVVDCPSEYESCYVLQTKGSGFTLTNHGCSVKNSDDDCTKITVNDVTSEKCYCNQDKCNSSTVVVTCSIVSMLGLILVIVYNCWR